MRSNQHLVGDEPSLRKEGRGRQRQRTRAVPPPRSFPQAAWDEAGQKSVHIPSAKGESCRTLGPFTPYSSILRGSTFFRTMPIKLRLCRACSPKQHA